MGINIYRIVGIVILFWLLGFPIYDLALGDGGMWYLLSVMTEGGQISYEDIMQFILIGIGIILIIITVFPHGKFKSALKYSLLQASKSAEDFSEKRDNPDAYTETLTRFAGYTILLGILFVVYLYLVYNIKEMALQGEGIGVLISQMVIIGIVAWANSYGVSKLEEKNGTIEANGDKIVIKDDNPHDNSMLWVLALLLINLVALGVGAFAADMVNQKLDETGTTQILEGDASQLGDVFQ